ncbi:MAG TPA: C-terminal binding protein [Burkholderiaceae bacterium]|nr:C-terminal binding protein [Burkholderiaceae bacterium]
MSGSQRLVVALDDGYASYDQEQSMLEAVDARFELRPCAGSEAAALRAVRGADIVLVRESPVSRSVIAAMDRCKGVVRYGIGVDNIDLAAARERSIAVANVPDYGIEEVSTHAVALLLAVVRQVLVRDRNVRSGRWSAAREQPMYRLRGRTLGLIGYGRIARQVQEKLAGFGFQQVLVHDPHARLPADVQPADIDEICAQADVVSLHAPLTPDTRHVIDEARLRLMRPTAILVNTARGGLVDLDALQRVLVERRFLGAGLDVFESEPPTPAHPVFELDNVVVSDHIGWYSEEAMRELQRKAAEEVVRILQGLAPKHWLNAGADFSTLRTSPT